MRGRRLEAIALCGAILLAASHAAGATPSDGCPAPPSEFGSSDQSPVSMEGRIYFLDKGTRKLPDFAALKSQGSIYTAKWDVPPRAFTQGFPGITNRFEWFAIDYQGPIYIPQAGSYGFRLGSDDGAILYVDGNVVINRDGLRAWSGTAGKAELTQGKHDFRLSYFQGPAYQIGLQLWVTAPGEKEKVFNLQDFNEAVVSSRTQLGVTEDANAIHVNLGAEVLFDTGKFTLRRAATQSLQQLANLMQSYPGLPVIIEGHTDSVGKPEANQRLSEDRANAVKQWLTTHAGLLPGCITTHGLGQTQPIATNDTADGRQKNRRVEIRIQKRKP